MNFISFIDAQEEESKVETTQKLVESTTTTTTNSTPIEQVHTNEQVAQKQETKVVDHKPKEEEKAQVHSTSNGVVNINPFLKYYWLKKI